MTLQIHNTLFEGSLILYASKLFVAKLEYHERYWKAIKVVAIYNVNKSIFSRFGVSSSLIVPPIVTFFKTNKNQLAFKKNLTYNYEDISEDVLHTSGLS